MLILLDGEYSQFDNISAIWYRKTKWQEDIFLIYKCVYMFHYIIRSWSFSCICRFRQYGLWERYADLYPDQDLIYTIGTSDYAKDWFFAQVTRKKDDDTYEGSTWQIKFQLDNVNQSGTFKLQISLATANIAELQIRINDPQADPPLFTTGVIGKDNTILRHGIHGLYWLYSIDIPATLLVEGNNTLFLTQPISNSPLAAFHGLMYDYIRLEGPPSSTSTRGVKPANMAPNTPLD